MTTLVYLQVVHLHLLEDKEMENPILKCRKMILFGTLPIASEMMRVSRNLATTWGIEWTGIAGASFQRIFGTWIGRSTVPWEGPARECSMTNCMANEHNFT
jgi:hypothetical protein